MDVPAANVAFESENEMRQFHTADISVAVAIPGGLITPIILAAEQKGFKQISTEMKDLATRARDGKLLPKEYQGWFVFGFEPRYVRGEAVRCRDQSSSGLYPRGRRG